MIYADSSFMIRLLTNEVGSEEAVALYRRLGRPVLVFGPFHELEVRNGLRHKAFKDKLNLPAAKRPMVDRELAAGESRLGRFLQRGSFQTCPGGWREAAERAIALSSRHTLRLGTRALDILHVGFALELKCRTFLTADLRQAALAKSTGLKVHILEMEA